LKKTLKRKLSDRFIIEVILHAEIEGGNDGMSKQAFNTFSPTLENSDENFAVF